MNRIFRIISKRLGLIFYNTKKVGIYDNSVPVNDYHIIFQPHSYFNLNILPEFKAMHLIRDPRDIAISGCFYHLHSNEILLHKPHPKLGGISYHDKINSLHNFDDKLLLEMEQTAARTINNIINWNYNQPNCIEVKYEDIIDDVSLENFDKIFLFLGFNRRDYHILHKVVEANSLFSNAVKAVEGTHVRSGRAGQWKKYFKDIHKKRFLELFGDSLIKLGYEKDNSWASS